MKKIVWFLLVMLLWADVFAVSAVDIGISSEIKRQNAETFSGALRFSVPNGWKLPVVPHIVPMKSKNLKDFKVSKELKKENGNIYLVEFSVKAENQLDKQLELSVECPLCSDICTIVSKTVSVDFSTIAPIEVPARYNFGFFLLLGFLGGLILNVMPCVLPVILMKLRFLGTKTAVWGSIAGNYTTFAAFTVFVAILKISGETAGWGMHFQNPNFLACMTIILFFLTLYSFEIITIFPPSIQTEVKTRRVFCSSFISSVVTSIIAIPCTAPFLGTAAAFAIQGTTAEMCAIFFAVATGFSAPYFVSFFVPFTMPVSLGRFGGYFKQVVNCGVFVTFLWVFWLLSHHLDNILIISYIVIFLAMAFLFFRKHESIALIVFLTLLSTLYIYSVPQKDNKSQSIAAQLTSELVRDHVVMIDITARWCLTCKYNKLHVFSDKRVVEASKKHNVKIIEGDITRKNTELTHIINKYNRVGIPFTVIYGPGAPSGILLNEIPTVNETVSAIEKASKHRRNLRFKIKHN